MDAEAKLLRWAASTQDSAFTNAQAVSAGVSPGVIRSRVEHGIWVRLHRSVYLPASVPVEWEQQTSGALLACGPLAVASFSNAAAVWGLRSAIEIPEVTVPNAMRRVHPGMLVHRSASLEAVTRRHFRVTHPRRTLLDLAATEPEEDLERAVDAFHRRRLTHPDAFKAYLDLPANRARPGSGVLREIVEARVGKRPIASDLETLLFRVLRKYGLPLPVPQYPVQTRHGPRYIDFAYPDQRLALECDGYEEHGSFLAFVGDRARQNEIEELGFHFRRFAWKQLKTAPDEVAFTVGIGLGLVPRRWGPPGGRGRRARAAADAAAPPRRTRRRA